MTDTPFPQLAYSAAPQYDPEAEQHVAAVASTANDYFLSVSKYVSSDMFYNTFNGNVFKACEEINSRDEEINIASIRSWFIKAGLEFNMHSWMKYVSYYTYRGADRGALRIRELYFRRELIRISIETAVASQDPVEDVFELFELHKSNTSQLYDYVMAIERDDSPEIKEELVSAAQDAIDGKAYMGAVRTGLRLIDDAIYGLMPGDNIVLAGRPGMGKTTVLLAIAKRVSISPPAGQKPKKTLLFTLESNKKRTIAKMAMEEAGLNSEDVKSGRIARSQLAEYDKAIDKIMKSDIIIYDNPDMKMSDIRSVAIKEQAKGVVGLIGVDYIQLITPSSKKGTIREQEVAEISRGLKKLALKLNIPVIALSQLSRKVEDRPGARPQMSDLRESGAIEQDADVIIMLYCPEIYGHLEYLDGESTKGVLEGIYAKNREGSLKSRFAHFDRPLGRIGNPVNSIDSADGSDFSDEGPSDTPF